MSKISEISVAILAGGKSVRFGYPKVLANFRGKPLIQHSIEDAISISNNVFIVVAKNSSLYFNKVDIYKDLIPEKGPLGGIFTALKFAQTPLVAIMPCDMPLLSPQIYRTLYHSMNTQWPIAAVFQRQIQPLVSIWPKRLMHELNYYLNENQTNVQKVLKKLNFQKFHLATESKAFLNINTRKDYQVLLQYTVMESYASKS